MMIIDHTTHGNETKTANRTVESVDHNVPYKMNEEEEVPSYSLSETILVPKEHVPATQLCRYSCPCTSIKSLIHASTAVGKIHLRTLDMAGWDHLYGLPSIVHALQANARNFIDCDQFIF
jgi:hypothetical protein